MLRLLHAPGPSAACHHLVVRYGGFLCGEYFRHSLAGLKALWVGPRPARWSFDCAETCLCSCVRFGRLRFFDKVFDETVIAVRELVTTLIAVECGG